MKCFSKLAQGLAIFSLSMVVVSTITFILSTVEELQQDEEGNIKYPNIAFTIELIDSFIVIFFTIEYFLRLVICPNKLRFLKDRVTKSDATNKQIKYFKKRTQRKCINHNKSNT